MSGVGKPVGEPAARSGLDMTSYIRSLKMTAPSGTYPDEMPLAETMMSGSIPNTSLEANHWPSLPKAVPPHPRHRARRIFCKISHVRWCSGGGRSLRPHHDGLGEKSGHTVRPNSENLLLQFIHEDVAELGNRQILRPPVDIRTGKVMYEVGRVLEIRRAIAFAAGPSDMARKVLPW